jgi:hypothetical protein
LVVGRKKKKYSPQRHKGHKGRKLTTEAQRHGEVIWGKDANPKRQGHGEKRAVVCGLFVLDLGRP